MTAVAMIAHSDGTRHLLGQRDHQLVRTAGLFGGLGWVLGPVALVLSAQLDPEDDREQRQHGDEEYGDQIDFQCVGNAGDHLFAEVVGFG